MFVTAGTFFHRTKLPLLLWFKAIWWLMSQKYGANALGLQRILGFGSYQTAWTWLHKLRRSMVRPGRDRLSGEVEVDESYVGGIEVGVKGRGAVVKVLVAVAAEVRGRAIGRIRMGIIPDASGPSLRAFIDLAVEAGATVITDGWTGYNGVAEWGFVHRIHVLRNSGKQAHELLPRVHRVVSLLKRWLLGTLQGAASTKHLNYYLDEFTFRFNRRSSGHRGLLFYRLLEQAVSTAPWSYRKIVGPRRTHAPKPDHNM
jgi:transposase-like protein